LKQRYYSLDVFRGATVALMILVNNPGSWSHIYSPLEHAAWHGVTPTDLVFPFFLFAVGNAMAFVMPRFEQGGDQAFWTKVIKRTLLIFLIGLFLNWSPFVRYDGDALVAKTWTWVNSSGEVVGIRILGVLQRIALAYFFASIIVYYAKQRGAFVIGMIMLLVYWLLCILGNPADPYSLAGWFGTDIDKMILGEPHMYHGERLNGKAIAFDPEGLIHTLPAIVQVIIGYLVGDYIIKKGKSYGEMEDQSVKIFFGPYQMLTGLFVAAVALLFAGYAWGLSFPINKKIWTSSYVIYTSGLAVLILATLIYAIEVRGMKGWWSRFFDVFGKNPLFIFFLSGFLPRLQALIRIPAGTNADGNPKYLSPFGWFYENVCAKVPGAPENGSLLYAICMIIFYWLIVYWMDKKKIYIKV
jgi:predicted acyltransferase